MVVLSFFFGAGMGYMTSDYAQELKSSIPKETKIEKYEPTCYYKGIYDNIEVCHD